MKRSGADVALLATRTQAAQPAPARYRCRQRAWAYGPSAYRVKVMTRGQLTDLPRLDKC
jgi:hypothetical protein